MLKGCDAIGMTSGFLRLDQMLTFAEKLAEKQKLNIKSLNKELLDREFLKTQFPNGIIDGINFCLGSVRGEIGNSLKLNVITGVWKDFASDDRRDSGRGVVSYLARMWNMEMADAAAIAAEKSGIKDKKMDAMVLIPAPLDDIQEALFHGRDKGALTGYWPYYDIDLSFLGYVCRFEYKGGKKDISPLTYRLKNTFTGDQGWAKKGWEGLHPIYGAQKLFLLDEEEGNLVPTNRPVLIVEGEKTADKAQQLFPKYDVIAWQGGSRAIHKVYWDILQGRDITLWPDNDAPGRKAMDEIISCLMKFPTESLKKVRLGEWQEKLAEGWDLADQVDDPVEGLNPLALLNEAERVSTRDQLMADYVYVSDIKRFFNIRNFASHDKEGLNNSLAHIDKKMADMFLQSTEFQKVDEVTYYPNRDRIVTDKKPDKLCLNLWMNHSPERLSNLPEEELLEKVKLFLNHVEYMIPEEKERKFFLDYLAYNVQYPGDKIHYCPLIKSVQGIGKSYFKVLFEKFLGNNVEGIDNDDLMEKNNSWIEKKSLVFIEEIMSEDRAEVTNRLLTLITEGSVRIKEKFLVSYSMMNRANFVIFTNKENPLLIQPTERRFWVYFSKAVPKEEEYYTRLFADIDENYQYVYEWMNRRGLKDFNPKGVAPHTTFKEEVAAFSTPRWQRLLDEMLEEKAYPFNRDIITIRQITDYFDEKRMKITHPRVIAKYIKDKGLVPLNEGNPYHMPANTRGTPQSVRLWAVRNQEELLATSVEEITAKWCMIADSLPM